jgi:hypothetical protein
MYNPMTFLLVPSFTMVGKNLMKDLAMTTICSQNKKLQKHFHPNSIVMCFFDVPEKSGSGYKENCKFHLKHFRKTKTKDANFISKHFKNLVFKRTSSLLSL